jgi:hypothetical protein
VAGSTGPNHERSSFFEADEKMMHSPYEELEYLADFLPEEGRNGATGGSIDRLQVVGKGTSV